MTSKLLLKGIRDILRQILGLIVGHSVLLFLYLIKSIKFIVMVRVRTDRIGHLAYNTHVFLKHVELKSQSGENILYLGRTDKSVANKQLLNMFKRRFLITQNKLARLIFGSLRYTNTSVFFKDLYLLDDTHYPPYKLENSTPSIMFTSSEEVRGRRLLDEMRIDEKDWFICFHARDSAYLYDQRPNRDWSYHNFRDCEIENYLAAAKYISSLGGFAIRMGHIALDKLPNIGRRIIDYAFNYRDDFGDVYLPSKCKYFLGNSSGLFLVSTIFGIPGVSSSANPLGRIKGTSAPQCRAT